jgi:hypothetical protein
VSALFLLALFLSIPFILYFSWTQRQEAESQLVKLIKQAGGDEITVQLRSHFGVRGVLHFDVYYVDINGVRQKRHVVRNIDLWGFLQGDFYWDKPLIMSDAQITEDDVERQR